MSIRTDHKDLFLLRKGYNPRLRLSIKYWWGGRCTMDTIDHTRQQSQARRLASALLTQPDDAACTACLDTLEEYVTAQLAGDDNVARWPEVASHLDACVAC